ncbi:hypothetical protein ALC53_10514 [Atta colombica]|uniref:Uncharacterized protein n=1 Tax=Atta colombica TaxID=520822 RepID=A0A195B3W0_9HYME|nr:hypothetical protein ALC53_10514 [Atta colombica]
MRLRPPRARSPSTPRWSYAHDTVDDEARRYRGNEDDAPFTSTAHISVDVNEKLSPALAPAYEIFQAFVLNVCPSAAFNRHLTHRFSICIESCSFKDRSFDRSEDTVVSPPPKIRRRVNIFFARGHQALGLFCSEQVGAWCSHGGPE